MANFPEIPSSVIADKDKKLLIAFMEANYETTVLDKRKGFDNLLKDCRSSILRQKRFHEKAIERDVINNTLEERLAKLREIAPEKNRYLLENDTTKWPWDYDRIAYEKAGIGLGTCFIVIKTQNRRIAVDRETAPLWFVK
jgi:hypothetical protein